MQDYSYLNDPVLDILVKASEERLPNKDHWWQDGGHRGTRGSTNCILLAIFRAAGSDVEHSQPAEDFLCEVGGFSCSRAAMRWNDAPGRTFAEVKALQLRAIETRLRRHNIIVAVPKAKGAQL